MTSEIKINFYVFYIPVSFILLVKTMDDYTIEISLKLVPVLHAFLKQKGFWYDGPKSIGNHRFTFLISGKLSLEKTFNYLRTLNSPDALKETQIIIYEGDSEFAKIVLKPKKE